MLTAECDGLVGVQRGTFNDVASSKLWQIIFIFLVIWGSVCRHLYFKWVYNTLTQNDKS